MSPKTSYKWLLALPDWVKTVGAMLTLLVAGGLASGFLSAPRVAAQADAKADSALVEVGAVQDALEVHEQTHDGEYSKIICILTLPDTVSPLESELACGSG